MKQLAISALLVGCAASTEATRSPFVASIERPVGGDGMILEIESPWATWSPRTTTSPEIARIPEEPELESDAEIEVRETPPALGAAPFAYTRELSDATLLELWKNLPRSLGPVAFGLAHEGRLVNAVPFPEDRDGSWMVSQPENAWGTRETIEAVVAAAKRVKSIHPDSHPLRVNAISARRGGPLRPHQSHQNGRDVDLGLFYPTKYRTRAGPPEREMDLAMNWTLLESIVSTGDVKVVLLDRRVMRALARFAASIGEDQAWIDALFEGPDAIVKHAPGHRDHFHVRYANPRAEELGRRIAQLSRDR